MQDAAPSSVQLQRMYRPEDVSRDNAYKAGAWDLYAPSKSDPDATAWADVEVLVGKCQVRAAGEADPSLGRYPCCRWGGGVE